MSKMKDVVIEQHNSTASQSSLSIAIENGEDPWEDYYINLENLISQNKENNLPF